jgi:fatty-acyl-CoA synthase
VPVAFIVLKEGVSGTEDEIMEFLQKKLARYKVPKKVVFLAELPLTSTGKINRRDLEMRAANLEAD